MSKPTQPPVDHPLEDTQISISGSEPAEESINSAEESSDQLAKPNLDEIRTAGF